ncbi:MAG: helix-turn-helix transcriptional regulator [Firmicutes bacterium]|nr:helix-turn-helix transcriptional regulator [Bacillota bacterium]
MIVYDRLWETMKKKGISQYSLIKNYHINETQLYRLRKNMVVKTITLDRLCEILDCEVEDICRYIRNNDSVK